MTRRISGSVGWRQIKLERYQPNDDSLGDSRMVRDNPSGGFRSRVTSVMACDKKKDEFISSVGEKRLGGQEEGKMVLTVCSYSTT